MAQTTSRALSHKPTTSRALRVRSRVCPYLLRTTDLYSLPYVNGRTLLRGKTPTESQQTLPSLRAGSNQQNDEAMQWDQHGFVSRAMTDKGKHDKQVTVVSKSNPLMTTLWKSMEQPAAQIAWGSVRRLLAVLLSWRPSPGLCPSR